jgi:23S rRNA pseudouridine2605 synthase
MPAKGGKPERLQKILAHAGLGSRRDCEEYISQGRVTVDGQVIRELGTKVDPEKATIAVDGERIQLEKMVYYAVNKPKGYVSTNDDPAGRPRVIDLLPEVPERVYSVGRLDEDSTGLMILTNDGELANRLAHPRYGVEKTYRALVAGLPSSETLAKLTEGIWLSDGKVRAQHARVVGTQGEAATLELVLAEGKKREIRRMLAKLGHKVMSLTRIALGPIVLKGLSPGEHRPLSAPEIDLLRKAAAGIRVSPPRRPDKPGGSHPSRSTKRPPGRPSASGELRPHPGGHSQPKRFRHGRAQDSRQPGPIPAKKTTMPPEVTSGESRPGEPRASRPSPGKPLPGRPLPGKPIPGSPVPGLQALSGRPVPGKPMPGRPVPGKPMPGKPVDARTSSEVAQPGKRPSAPRGGKPGVKSPGHSHHALRLRSPQDSVDQEPSPQAKPSRKIIGLDPTIAAQAGLLISGRPARKRPAGPRRPPRRVFGIKREGNGEDGS